jgi:hypothetical protein
MSVNRVFNGSDFQKVLSELILFNPEKEKEYELIIKEYRKKRSLDANAYCWALLGELSKVLKIPANELYKHFIRQIGAFTIVPIKTQAIAKFGELWNSHGVGWLVDDLGESKLDGFHNLKCYHGSSSYDSKEMAILIDEIVEACKENGIETATGAELDLLKRSWK